MTNAYESANILLLSKNPSIIDATRASLTQEENLNLIENEITSLNLFQIIAQVQPDVILLDFEFQTNSLDLVDNITSEYPQSAVIAILSEPDMINLDRVVLSGARAFIQYPFPADKLLITIKRVVTLTDRNQSQGGPSLLPETNITHKNTFMVFSPKGGAGTTTIATNLAISLHKNLKDEDVLLLDGKHLFGHVALYLNILTGNSITDLIAHAGMLDPQLIKQVVLKHKSGIHVLPSPNSITEAQGIGPESLFKVIRCLQQVFPYVIIDGGNNLNDNTVTYMDSSDKILLVLNPDIASMRDIRQFMEITTTLSYPKDKILFILNQSGRKAEVKRNEIEDVLEMELFGMIPADDDMALSSMNEGIPILLKKPRHPISKAFTKISQDLIKFSRTAKFK